MFRHALVATLVTAAVGAGLAAPGAALVFDEGVDPTPQVRRLTFPVEGPVSYWDDFGACRSGCTRGHEGNDLIGERLQHLLAANAGTVRFTRTDASGNSGNMLILEDVDGWEYWYIHINNDSPGTDDGTNPPEWILAPDIEQGSFVEAGQHIAYMGDSGNAEESVPHVHFELHRPDGLAVNPWYSLRLSQGLRAGDWCDWPSNPQPHPDPAAGAGYWTIDQGGSVSAFGSATHHGDLPTANGQPVGLTPTATGAGYWIATTAGEVFALGDATHHGDMEGVRLNAPIVGIAVTPGGDGYWLFARDGGVFSFGDADFYGSTGAMALNAPVVGMAVTPGGLGYWLFAQDGGVFSFGDADFYGSTGDLTLNAPVIGMVGSATGSGYLLLGSDGGAFAFGDARFHGSVPGMGLCDAPTAYMLTPSVTGGGYWILADDGRIIGFGDAPFHGDPAEHGERAVAMAVVPAGAPTQPEGAQPE